MKDKEGTSKSSHLYSFVQGCRAVVQLCIILSINIICIATTVNTYTLVIHDEAPHEHQTWYKALILKPYGWSIAIQIIITLTFVTVLNLMTNIFSFI